MARKVTRKRKCKFGVAKRGPRKGKCLLHKRAKKTAKRHAPSAHISRRSVSSRVMAPYVDYPGW